MEAGKEEALGSVLAEIAGLKEEKTVKMLDLLLSILYFISKIFTCGQSTCVLISFTLM